MINNSEFADRLLKIMEYHQLSASAFADRIQVQRSSISHLLSGRNKPSLDFVMKVIREFKEVELYWLLNGKGSFPASSPAEKFLSSPSTPAPALEKGVVSEPGATEVPSSNKKIIDSVEHQIQPDRAIERIVVFFNDGTFKSYLP